ncbi:tail protein [Citrobacter phage HCF1]|uniref:Tail protein n=1 Tax=Citrobacter phage HCF1 TaxID=2849700 RepID=A0ABX6D675_9CAUD|nr:tail protein [Citrobacter phage HCF1]
MNKQLPVPVGAKGGSSKPKAPYEMEDNLISIDKIKILLAVSDGEVDPSFSLMNLYLDDVPVQSSNGILNYPELRLNLGREHNIKITLKDSPIPQAKLHMARGVKAESDGDQVGVRVEYAVDMAVDGGAYSEYMVDVIDGKTTSGYDRSRRIDLPAFNTQVLLRIRRVTPDSQSGNVVDAIQLQSYAEVIDAKFRYPLTGLVYVEFDSKLFPNQIPNISIKKKWKLINVPVNYDPFHAHTPARGMEYGRKRGVITPLSFCTTVPNGKGGTEPRYLCDVVIQSQIEAYQLIRDICSIFRGMSFWNGESLSIVIDKPRNPSYIFTNENVIGGEFTYTFASEKSMYTQCNVTFDDAQNFYAQDVEGVFDPEMTLRFGHNPTAITAIGCTRRSEANRRGRWILKTNVRSTTVNFATGLEGMIPTIGDVIIVADNFWSSALTMNLSGRVMEVSGLQVFLPFKVDARAGDRIIVNKPDGAPVGRTIASVTPDGKTITLNTTFGFDVQPDSIFAIERTDLAQQQYVVTEIKRGDGEEEFTYSITAVEYDPNKYDEIDYGVNIDDRPTSIVQPDILPAPENVKVSSYSRIVQGMSVETMRVTRDKVEYATLYEMQWRKDNGNWNNTPQTASKEIEVEGIYAGNYHVRVRSVSSNGSSSGWSKIVSVHLKGKVGEPGAPINMTASDNEVFGIRVKWGMPEGSGDTAYIELHRAPNSAEGHPIEDQATLLTLVPYPQYEYWHSILPAGQVIWYKARAIDRIGNVSQWTDFVRGMSSVDTSIITDHIKVDIENSEGINSKNGKFTAQIKESLRLIANETEARVTQVSQLEADFDGKITAQNSELREVIATGDEALSRSIDELRAEIGDDIQGQITEVKEAIVTETDARVTADTALSTRIGDNEAAINQKLDSDYGVNLGLKYNGQEYSAGMALSLVGDGTGVKSQMLFSADRFAIISNAQAGAFTLPFVVENNRVYARGVKAESDGDQVGVRVEYAVDMAVDGGAYSEYMVDVIDGKTTSGYDRSRRIDLPAFNTQVLLRIRRVTPDSQSGNVVDAIQLQSYAEVIDAKFRYPLTGLVYVEFDSKLFPNQIPNISIKKKWKLINVPVNYDPFHAHTPARGMEYGRKRGVITPLSFCTTFINSLLVKDGTITTAKIAQQINSTNWSSGSAGWMINKNGIAEFNRYGKGKPLRKQRGIFIFINSLLVKDGTITTAKIAQQINSTNWSSGSAGWMINKNGIAEFNRYGKGKPL